MGEEPGPHAGDGGEEEEAGEEGGEEAQGEEGQEGQEAQGQEEEKEEEGEEEEEEAQEEEGQEGALRRRQAEEGPAQVQVQHCCWQEERRGAEEEGHWPLQAGVVLGCPLGGHGHQGQVDPRQIFKALWVHIKKKGLNKGRNVGKIDGIFGGGSMFKLPGAVSKHIK